MFTGIDGTEITAAMDALGLGPKSRAVVMRNVKYMGREAAQYLNALAKSKK